MSEDIRPPKVLPPHYLAMAVVLMIASLWVPVNSLIKYPWPWVGVIFVFLGLAIAGWAAWQFSRAKTNIIPLSHSDALVVSGVYIFTRNPMYFGMMSLLVGVALLVNNWLAWLVLPIFFLIIRYGFIAREEVLMLRTFGDDYSNYCQQVRRWC